ncbi:MAG: anhydro-N-acetylmuramic acid kinase [Flavobacteriaceae bacterium]|nr:anhydro-N-acetylmuramic acid kinase [Formosa sp.]MDG1373961.1 anhydro-N-acetylmuramic acid kinase [Flavobacteriaceae bacterium]MDG2498444.1 anhydro-N-acetylmuramic acid kinase [Flavobacteriaceae bacterium]
MRNSNLKNKSEYYILGVMSGTSLDGIDLCLSSFQFVTSWKFQIISAKTVEYSKVWKYRLRNAIDLNPLDLEKLNQDYTQFLAEVIQSFMESCSDIVLDAVCSHGHTVFHEPAHGKTLQIGNLAVLANYLNKTLVCDFRTQDVALGGQGAPLVPIGDALLFSEYDYCLNLGGFANISFEHNSKRMAFDICPVNIILNHFVALLGKEYDSEGQIASTGSVCISLLEELNDLEFYKQLPPKSLGLEWVQSHIFQLIETYNLEPASLLRTLVEHCAIQLSIVLNQNHLKKGLITGGGVFNSFLMQRLSELTKCDLQPANPMIIEFKEALIFGFLGVLKLRNEPNCLQSVTGASRDHSSGVIYLPEKKD